MIIRTQKTKNYSIMANECLRNPKISSRAKGIYAYIMTLPDNWKLHKKELYQNFPEGRDFLDKGFNELRDLGYIKQERIKDETGKFIGCEYMVYEHANQTIENKGDTKDSDQIDNTITGKSGDGQKPQPENPYTVKPCMANPHLLKTEEEQNTKKKKELKTNKKIFDEVVDDGKDLASESVSSSSSFFVEAEEVSLADRKKDLSEDLIKLGLGKGQINILFRRYPMDVIDEALFTTLNASYSQAIDSSEAQYFYGTLKNIFTAEQSA